MVFFHKISNFTSFGAPPVLLEMFFKITPPDSSSYPMLRLISYFVREFYQLYELKEFLRNCGLNKPKSLFFRVKITFRKFGNDELCLKIKPFFFETRQKPPKGGIGFAWKNSSAPPPLLLP